MRSFRVERRVVIAGAAVLALLGAGPAPVSVADGLPPAFPDGAWAGDSLYGGEISKPGSWAVATGDVSFILTVSNGNVADGLMIVNSSNTGSGNAQITLKGSLELSGSAAFVEFSGPVTLVGTVTASGYTAPINFTGISDGTMSPFFSTCNMVTGDLATQARNIQESLGYATGVTGLFAAFRTGGSAGTANEVVDEYDALAAAMEDLVKINPSPEQVLEMTELYEALGAKIAAIGACFELPPGFQSGLSNMATGSLFQALLQKALNDPDAYTVQELLSLLASGLRMGAVGSAIPGSGGYQDTAESLMVQFEATLEAKLDAAAAAGDLQAVQDIWIAASQLGLKALAAKAKNLWATDK